jgi:hypothetical protein
MTGRDIPEEIVEKAARALVPTLAKTMPVPDHLRDKARRALSAALAGRQVVDRPAEPVDELAARVLDEHLLTGPRPGQCRCGWGDGSDVRTLGRSHSKHVVKQLRAAGALAGSGSGED